mmetsp:Transcript_12640/g.15932  ORF Transcript_12640/g.15932 Transcript_12640/m.15932 type:complete len:336 (-) Transcript_12640:196-1203(-)|eukprot:CAMPEP_0172495752 /NCGR_PEP_ID=MMETSP1066-20121228/75914_1 /TAXON_ID=671091 /ORGANISM="Coscinodiscus wailesii, Strain CCMP2513" /LENGTH=335 /DNA_ID=CAMNT_0013267633 /DNA_START=77 /DNA_END=1084 /DNA_ORIENTATION=-
MANNTKKKSKNTKNINGAATPTAETPNSTAQPGNNTVSNPALKGISPPRLTMIVCICVGVSYIAELNNTVNDGESSTNCSEYFSASRAASDDGSTSCTPVELFFIQAKYYTSLLSLFVVFAIAWTCWNDPPALQRVNVTLCLAPLSSTLMLLLLNPNVLTHHRKVNFLMMGVLLMTVAWSSQSVGLAPLRGFYKSSALDTFIFIYFLTMVGFVGSDLRKGVEEYTVYDPEELTEGAKLLFYFLAVDRMTVALQIMNALLFFDDVRKRIMLLFIGMANLFESMYQLPYQELVMTTADKRIPFLQGTAVVALFLSVVRIPKVKLPKKKRKGDAMKTN